MASRPKIHCPNCQSMHVRTTKANGFFELIGEFLGTYSFRCGRCGLRFQHRVFTIGSCVYAKCPKCFRMDLTTWTESHYRPRFGMRLKMFFGAKRVRCEACRCNFVSFRRRESTYVRPNGGAPPELNRESDFAAPAR